MERVWFGSRHVPITPGGSKDCQEYLYMIESEDGIILREDLPDLLRDVASLPVS